MSGFTKIDNNIIRATNITAREKLVYIVLKSFSPSFPSITKIMKMTGFGKKTVLTCLRKLEQLGCIKRVGRSGRSNLYTFPTWGHTTPGVNGHQGVGSYGTRYLGSYDTTNNNKNNTNNKNNQKIQFSGEKLDVLVSLSFLAHLAVDDAVVQENVNRQYEDMSESDVCHILKLEEKERNKCLSSWSPAQVENMIAEVAGSLEEEVWLEKKWHLKNKGVPNS